MITNKTSTWLLLALISLGGPAVVAVESVPVNVTEEMLFTDDPKEWLKISRVSPPVYPKELFDKGITGYVDLEVTIDEQGRVKQIGTVTSKPSIAAFEESARESVKYWQFKEKLSGKCTPEVAQGNVRVWYEIKDGKESISVSSMPGTMLKNVAADAPKWFPMLNLPQIKRELRYPADARKYGEQGVVYAVLHIDVETGMVRKVEFSHAIVSAPWVRFSFEAAIRFSMKAARFEPKPEERGKTLKACLPFAFRLR